MKSIFKHFLAATVLVISLPAFSQSATAMISPVKAVEKASYSLDKLVQKKQINPVFLTDIMTVSISAENNQYILLQILSIAVKSMSEGELLQIEKARRMDIDEAIYYEIIRGKTASLIASACSSGAATSGIDAEGVERMRVFGEKIGMAFQIKDDLFEFGWDDVGKPLGTDIKEKKMTLPLIYALNNAKKTDRNRIIDLIKRKNSETAKINEVINFVRNSGGMEYANTVMQRYKAEALEILLNFPASASRDAMQELVDYVISRKN